MNLMRYFQQKASWKRVIILFCTSAVLATCIVTMLFGLIKLDPDATMDSLSFYSGDTFFENLDIQGQEGRRAYIFLHLIDYLFISQFYFFFIYLIVMLLRRSSKKSITQYLCLIPLLPAAMDLLENILIDISIILYPVKVMVLGHISGIFTFLKMYSLYAVFLVIAFLLILFFIKLTAEKKTRTS